MITPVILQAQAAQGGSDLLVGFLVILLLIFPVLFVRGLLKGWHPESGAGMFWKVALIFGSPIYIGIIIIKLLEVTGMVTPDFAALFPNIKAPIGHVPDVSGVPSGTLNFWSEFTVGLMVAVLISGVVAVFIYLLFGNRKPSHRVGTLIFWAAMYFSSLLVASSAFDQLQEFQLTGQPSRIQKVKPQREQKEDQSARDSLGIFGSLVRKYEQGREQEEKAGQKPPGLNAGPQILSEYFRTNKEMAEAKMGKMAGQAPDSLIVRLLRYTNAQVTYLAARDPMACHYFFRAGSYLKRFSQTFYDAARDPKVARAREDFERELAAPSSPATSAAMSEEEYRATTDKLMRTLHGRVPIERQNFDVFYNPQKLSTTAEKRAGCFTYLAFVEELSSLPGDEAVRYYRRLLEEQASAMTAEELLEGDAELAAIYQRLAPGGSPLDIIFKDNPTLKKDFVRHLIESYLADPASAGDAGERRKRDLLDANIQYYFKLATDDAIFEHIRNHYALLGGLRDANPIECGRWAGVHETFDPLATTGNIANRHDSTLATVMKSAWYNQEENPARLDDSALSDALEGLEDDMKRTLKTPFSMDGLIDPASLTASNDKRNACLAATEFYHQLTTWRRRDAAAFYRAFIMEDFSFF